MNFKFYLIPFFLITLSFFDKPLSISSSNLIFTDSIERKIDSGLIKYFKTYPREKIFIHTDQGSYVNGETIWYKLYCTSYGRPTLLSGIVYIDLIDDKNVKQISHKLPLENGLAFGNVDLPDSLKTGFYQLRCYTLWMLNFSEAEIEHKTLYIQNLAEHKDTKISQKETSSDYDVRFFPEGGDLVDGCYSLVAFKAVDGYGRPLKISGEIKNGDTVIAKFKTTHDGMGNFTMQAFANQIYKVNVRFHDGSEKLFQLPPVKRSGVVLNVLNIKPETLEIKIVCSRSQVSMFDKSKLAVFQTNGRSILYSLDLNYGVNIFRIPKKIFSTGIVRLTHFDNFGNPTAERIVFINHHDQLSLDVKPDSLDFSSKGRIILNLEVKDQQEKPVPGNFSVSITDASLPFDSTAGNIYTGFLLSSDLRGSIFRPWYYFSNSSDSLRDHLDLVMLTNGWRHFVWKDVLENKFPLLHYPVEKKQFIAGKIPGYSLKDTKNVRFQMLIDNFDSSRFLGYVSPDSTGSFMMEYMQRGASKIYIQILKGKNKTQPIQASLYTFFKDSVSSKPAQFIYHENLREISQLNVKSKSSGEFHGRILQEVMVQTKALDATQQLINKYVTSLYTSDREFSIDLVNKPFSNGGLIDFLKGKFPGLQITQDGDKVKFAYRGGSVKLYNKDADQKSSSPLVTEDNEDKPYFYFNESRVSFESIKDVSLTDVALIRFIPPPVSFAPYGGGDNGAILIYGRKGGEQQIKSPLHAPYSIFEGFSVVREFYSPDYSIEPGTIKDERSTLYWNPNFNTHEIENKVRFYNSDSSKAIRVIIQGMDAMGRIGYFNKVF